MIASRREQSLSQAPSAVSSVLVTAYVFGEASAAGAPGPISAKPTTSAMLNRICIGLKKDETAFKVASPVIEDMRDAQWIGIVSCASLEAKQNMQVFRYWYQAANRSDSAAAAFIVSASSV